MADIPNTRFINFVDSPAPIQYSQFGEARVPLDASTGHIVDIHEFRQVSVRIGQTSAPSFEVFMGKISGATLSVRHTHLVDGTIHTFDVVGPQMTLYLKGGAPKSKEQVQLWVYLRS